MLGRRAAAPRGGPFECAPGGPDEQCRERLLSPHPAGSATTGHRGGPAQLYRKGSATALCPPLLREPLPGAEATV